MKHFEKEGANIPVRVAVDDGDGGGLVIIDFVPAIINVEVTSIGAASECVSLAFEESFHGLIFYWIVFIGLIKYHTKYMS